MRREHRHVGGGEDEPAGARRGDANRFKLVTPGHNRRPIRASPAVTLISTARPISAPAAHGGLAYRDQGRDQEREPDQRVTVAAVHDDDDEDRVEAEEDERGETSSRAPDDGERQREGQRGEDLAEEARREAGKGPRPMLPRSRRRGRSP